MLNLRTISITIYSFGNLTVCISKQLTKKSFKFLIDTKKLILDNHRSYLEIIRYYNINCAIYQLYLSSYRTGLLYFVK